MPQLAVTVAGGWFAGSSLGAMLIPSGVFGSLLTSVAVGALQTFLGKMLSSNKGGGIRSDRTQTGGVVPLAWIFGTYVTAGSEVCPPMSHGSKNKYLTYVINLGDIAGQTLQSLLVNGEATTASGTPHATYGTPLTGRFAGRAWLKYYNGSQTAADPYLLATYGGYGSRPWSASMVGYGMCYAILTFQYDRKVFTQMPEVRFVMGGIPLYDPRLDSTVGGVGPQRWADRTTWAVSDNPVVQAYNILRGITIPGIGVWGGECEADDLPLANWMAQMNKCDVLVTTDTGTEKRYRSSYEIIADDEPKSVLAEIMKACSGETVNMGGVWKVLVGEPDLPVLTVTDDHMLVTKPQELDPFPDLNDTKNAVHCTYPEPADAWASKEAPARYDAGFEVEDDGQRLIADITLAAVPHAKQVQRQMNEWLKDARRFRSHVMPLSAAALVLEPLDSIEWTSERNGYTAKVFQVERVVDDLLSLKPVISARERDPDDYDYDVGDLIAVTTAATDRVAPPNATVSGFAVSAYDISVSGTARRPAILMEWTPENPFEVLSIQWEVRLTATGQIVAAASTTEVASGRVVIDTGILPATAYEVRSRLNLATIDGDWTAWLGVTTNAVYLGQVDLDGSKLQSIVLGPVSVTSNTIQTHATLDLGAIPFGQIWKRAIVFEARRTVAVNYTIRLERRSMYAGVWSAWGSVQSFTITSNSWDIFADSATFAGAYDDFEYRLVSDTTGSVANGEIRNIYLTAVNIVK